MQLISQGLNQIEQDKKLLSSKSRCGWKGLEEDVASSAVFTEQSRGNHCFVSIFIFPSRVAMSTEAKHIVPGGYFVSSQVRLYNPEIQQKPQVHIYRQRCLSELSARYLPNHRTGLDIQSFILTSWSQHSSSCSLQLANLKLNIIYYNLINLAGVVRILTSKWLQI